MDSGRSNSRGSRPSSIYQRRLGFISPRDWDKPPEQAPVVPAHRNCICCRPGCACCAQPNKYAMHRPSLPRLRLSTTPMRYYALQFSPYVTEYVDFHALSYEPSIPEIVVSPSPELDSLPIRRKFSFEDVKGQTARSSSLPVTTRKRYSLHNQSISSLDASRTKETKRRSMSAQVATGRDVIQPPYLKRQAMSSRMLAIQDTQSETALKQYCLTFDTGCASLLASPEEVSPTTTYFAPRSPSLPLHAPQPLSTQKFSPPKTVQEAILPPCPLPILRPFLDYGTYELESPLPIGESSLGPLGAFSAEIHAGFDARKGLGSMRDIWAYWVAQRETAGPGKRRGDVRNGVVELVELDAPKAEKGVLDDVEFGRPS